MRDIFEFNHIDKTLDPEVISTIKEFYSYYHKMFWCHKKNYKRFKIFDNMINISSITLVAVGTISGGVTLNPIILGVVNGVGVVISGIGKKKNYKRKIETSRFAFTTYQKVLVELRSALRGDEWNKEEFIDRMKLVDEMIIDQCPTVDKFINKYNGGSASPQSPPAY